MLCRVLVQNIARSRLGGGGRSTSNIAPVRISVHNSKPTFIILTECCEDETFTGNKTFRGYKLVQISRAGGRAGGVAVFAKKNTSQIPGTVRSSADGHFSVAAYDLGGTKVVLGAVYGPSSNSDREAVNVYRPLADSLRELTARVGTTTMIIAGDLNLKLDKLVNNGKPGAVWVVTEIMIEFDMLDSGHKHGSAPTWRRSRAGQKSRLDYILHSSQIGLNRFSLKWGRLDHAEICADFEIGIRHRTGPPLLKDWVLAHDRFLGAAPDMIKEVILDHDREMRTRSYVDREHFVNGRAVKLFESELTLGETEEGVCNAHVFKIILNRITTLQRRVQTEIISEQKKKLTDINTAIGNTYLEIDNMLPGDPREGELRETLVDLQTRLQNYCENVDLASRQRIENFYATNNGKSTAASFYVTKEKKSNKNFNKLVDGNVEVTDPQRIAELLQENYRGNVGETFLPTRTLGGFLLEHGVVLPTLTEEQKAGLDADITVDEVKMALSSAKAGSAPGPSGQSIAVFKYF